MNTSSDNALDCAYKLEEYAGKARRKRSEASRPGPSRYAGFRSPANIAWKYQAHCASLRSR